MRPDTLQTVRLASIFYLVVAFVSVLYAFLFGHLNVLLGERAASAGGLLEGALAGILIVVVCNAALVFRPMRRAAEAMGRFLGPLGPGSAVYLAMVSGFAEELCFRGALWPHLGLYGTSILFGILHTVPSRALALYPLFAALAGLVFGLLRQRTGSIWPPVLAHALINGINLTVIGRLEGRRAPAPREAPEPGTVSPLAPPMALPEDAELIDRFPVTVWRYDLRVELEGTDRDSLQECLEHEELALFACVPRDEVYEQFREGRFVFTHSFTGPFAAFPSDLATLSAYLFQPVIGIEVAERYSEPEVTDDVRAWKIVAQRGEWVKVPLVVHAVGDGTFRVDQDADDQEVLAAHWAEYPRWFQDGMRFKYPRLRDL